MKTALSIIVLFLSCGYHVFAQSNVQDSIQQRIAQIRRMPADTAQVIRLRQLGHDLTEKDKQLSYALLKEALDKSLAIGERNTITDCYRLMGIWHSTFREYNEAMQYYRLSYQSAEENKNLFLMAGVLYNMGNIKYWKSEYDSSIYFYQQSQQLFEAPDFLEKANIKQNKLDQRLSELYSNLSMVFSSVKNLKKADEYIDKAITITQKYPSRIAQENLAEFMMQKADNYDDNNETEKALRLRLQYLPVLEEKHFKYTLAGAYQGIAKDYLQLGQDDSAALFAQKHSVLATELNQDIYLANTHLLQAGIAFRKKDYASADEHAQLAKPYYEKTEDIHEQSEFYALMKDIAYARGRFAEAYGYFEKYDQVKDSLQSSKRAIAFSEMEMRYETEKKATQIRLQQSQLKQKNLFNYILMGGAVALLVILALSYRNYNSRKKIQQQRISELETEKQLLATQSLLQGQEDERSRLAKDLHDGLGGLLSGVKLQLGAMKGNLLMTESNSMVFERALDKLDESIREMRRVAHNMMPEALLKLGLKQAVSDYCEGLSHQQPFTINCELLGLDERMDNTVEVVLYRIVQELVNNAVKHSGASDIFVQVMRQDENRVSVTVEDNGKGFDMGKAGSLQSAGIRNIRSRVNYLKGTMDIKTEPGKGTSVFIECNATING